LIIDRDYRRLVNIDPSALDVLAFSIDDELAGVRVLKDSARCLVDEQGFADWTGIVHAEILACDDQRINSILDDKLSPVYDLPHEDTSYVPERCFVVCRRRCRRLGGV
jgi:hypothetical protein